MLGLFCVCGGVFVLLLHYEGEKGGHMEELHSLEFFLCLAILNKLALNKASLDVKNSRGGKHAINPEN